ncbi:MAG: ABC transporter permease subunit [bacterium]|nr:ABC transporter permease subunit [bacterium]
MSKQKSTPTRTSGKSIGVRIYYYRWFYVMALPVLVLVTLFNYLPMLGIRYAFYDYKPIGTPAFVGFKHFQTLFSRDAFWTAFFNTLQISVFKLLLTTLLAVVVSLMLNEMRNILAKKTFQTIIYLPHFLSWVVAASVFSLILSPSDSGLVNAFLKQIGVLEAGQEIYFLASKQWWRLMYYIIDVWKDTGWGTILYLATLAGISPDLYEAAEMDGANRWQQLRFITLPALYNTIITVLILNLAKVLNLFEPVFVLYNEAVYDVADVLQTYIYRQTFGVGVPNYGYTTAVGLFKSLVACMLVLACNWASKKVRGRGIV